MTQIFSSERIIVTGSNGKLGKLVLNAWHAAGTPGVEIITQSRHSDSDVIWAPGQSLEVFPACQSVIALWGCTHGNEAELQDNIQLAQHSRAIAKHCGAKRVIHLSSAAVYGSGRALVENAPLLPVNAYGRAKCDMEALVETFRQHDPFAHLCLRLANVVGADSLTPALQGDRPLHLDRFPDGAGPKRSYIAPGDLSKILLALCAIPAAKLPKSLNIAAPLPVDMANLAKAAGIAINWRDAPSEALAEVSLSTTCLATLLPDQIYQKTAHDMILDWRRHNTKLQA
ncbi:NAD(P)-dependent oxidoreductase [Roseovarius sp. EL26]|uniref:NAD-dependent epimerase/dehydratase family protein n=1 Tax=Roseovarius sp. EL26 TaxID=2126672 RepID=UPI0013C42B10|nr:NAD-dependent epimerase/dehydratase family protein [Roseovarius sp. EL26]